MADKPVGVDKLPLRAWVENIAEQMIGALDAVEKRHPDWEYGRLEMVTRAVLRPMQMPDGTTEVWVDINEPKNETPSDIPINLRRRMETGTVDVTPTDA